VRPCPAQWIVPDWPAPANVRALITTRAAGLSAGAYASMNLSDRVGDDPARVQRNREVLRQFLPAEPKWLRQVHGTRVVCADESDAVPEADASVATLADVVCAVLSADCLPILLCDEVGSTVAAVHAGWRGLCSGVIESAVAAMNLTPDSVLAYLGPAIGPQQFEVGGEVRDAFVGVDAGAARAFAARPNGKWLADLYALARLRLARLGVERVWGGDFCTFAMRDRFYSYRRDGATGRMAALIWIDRRSVRRAHD
jgi:polyphenol oxidase